MGTLPLEMSGPGRGSTVSLQCQKVTAVTESPTSRELLTGRRTTRVPASRPLQESHNREPSRQRDVTPEEMWAISTEESSRDGNYRSHSCPLKPFKACLVNEQRWFQYVQVEDTWW